MTPIDIEPGQNYGRLTIMGEAERPRGAKRRVHVRCECGATKVVWLQALRRGNTQSCGCLRAETSAATGRRTATSHGMKNTPTWRSWSAMKTRCLNPNATDFALYGGRGITVCDRWRNSFENFLDDMGPRPPGTSIDRIDVDGNYEPGNCRWATAKEQASNRRSAA